MIKITLSDAFANPANPAPPYANWPNEYKPVMWMFNGIACTNSEQFAALMWPDDEQARLMFLLKHPK
jgi:hypothetical protein